MSVNIQPGDIILYRPRGLISWLIAKVSRSEYSHVAIAISNDEIIEADFFIKSKQAPLHYKKKINSVYRLKNLTPEQQQKIVESAKSLEGKRYDYSQIFELFLRFMFNYKTTVFNHANRFICSEVIDRAFVKAGIPRKDQNNLFDISPQEVLQEYDVYKVS